MCKADTVKVHLFLQKQSRQDYCMKLCCWNIVCFLLRKKAASQFFEYIDISNIHFDQFWFILAAIMNQSWLPMAVICVSHAHQHHIPGISPGSRFGKLVFLECLCSGIYNCSIPGICVPEIAVPGKTIPRHPGTLPSWITTWHDNPGILYGISQGSPCTRDSWE